MQNMGEHILLDLYACLEDRISTAEALTDNAIKAFSHVCECEETPSCTTFDEEIVLTVVTAQCHMILHAYPALGYVAADLYTYKKTLRTKQFIKDLRRALGAERIKSTSIRRGDFGSQRDMKPRKKTNITALGRVKRTGAKLKRTGSNMLNKFKGKKNK